MRDARRRLDYDDLLLDRSLFFHFIVNEFIIIN